MTLLEVKNINAGYGKKQVLYDISFKIEQGEIVLLIGSNGSGKSTLLKVIYGLLTLWNKSKESSSHKTGKIYFDGEDITDLSTFQLLKKGLLYIPQQNSVFADMTVKENLEISGLTISGRSILKERIEKALIVFPSLIPHLKRLSIKLSGGERQLLTMAMAIIHEPKMILIDEPFNALSPQNLTFVRENLKMLNQKKGITFLIVEHQIREALDLCNTVIALKSGCLLFADRIDSQADDYFKEVFT